MNETFDFIKGLILRIIIGIAIFLILDTFWITVMSITGAGSSLDAFLFAITSTIVFIFGYRYIPKGYYSPKFARGSDSTYEEGEYDDQIFGIEKKLQMLQNEVDKETKGLDYWEERQEKIKKDYIEGRIGKNEFLDKSNRYIQWLMSIQKE